MSCDENIALRVTDVGKRYEIYDKPSHRLWQMLCGGKKQYFKEFWALNEVSIDVRKGECVGIIGRNGAGKSTLLQIVTGTLTPTTGTVELNGRVAALLELGSGFNPEFTGRENISLSASIMGLSPQEAEAIYEEVVAFADIGDYIEQPLKTYSSGMMVRLGFAVQTMLIPDVLIVDEALSVGDVFFQQKCFRRIRELIDGGSAVLFVSHDMTSIRNLCDRAVLLRHGSVYFDGVPEDAASIYYGGGKAGGIAEEEKVSTTTHADWLAENNILGQARERQGSRMLEIKAAAYDKTGGRQGTEVAVFDELVLSIQLLSREYMASPIIGIHVYDRMNNLVFASNSAMCAHVIPPMHAGDTRLIRLKLHMNVQVGIYSFSLGCSDAGGKDEQGVLDRIEGLGPIHVYAQDTAKEPPFHGMFYLPMEVEDCL